MIGSIAAVLALTGLTVFAAGEQPWHVLQVLLSSAFGSAENVSYTLFYATPLLISGTAVQVALDAGLFNIGAEGQLYLGALGAITWAALAHALPGPVIALGAFVSALIFGGAWGALAGYLRARRDTHEVIATIMLNFIALALVNWAILGPLKNPDIQYPETVWIRESSRIPRLWHQVTPGLPVALFIAWFFLWARKNTWWGYRFRAVGENETAAAHAGISPSLTRIFALGLSGAIAGLIGYHEVFCNSYRLIDGFSPGYGFTGLALALLSRGSFPKMVLSALLFAALQKGALDLDIETDKITRDFSLVIQAFILFGILLPKWSFRSFFKKAASK